MTTTYLDLDATTAASLARGERVERWVRMEPQPPEGIFTDKVVEQMVRGVMDAIPK